MHSFKPKQNFSQVLAGLDEPVEATFSAKSDTSSPAVHRKLADSVRACTSRPFTAHGLA